MKEFLKYFDFGGANLNFQINRKEKVTSWQAGLLSLFFISICLCYTISNLYYYVNLSFTTNYSQINYNSQPIIKVDDLSYFMIAFCQGTGGNSTLRDPIAMSAVESTFEWHYFIRNPWLIEDKVFINLTVCKPEDFPSIVSESYSVRLFQNCMCASKASLANYNISFFNTDTYASYFTYKLMFKNEIFNNPAAYQNYSNYDNSKQFK